MWNETKVRELDKRIKTYKLGNFEERTPHKKHKKEQSRVSYESYDA